jgi:acetyl esterase/lipase
MMRAPALLLVCALLTIGAPVQAQRVMSAGEIGTLAAGAPAARIAYGPSPLQFANLRMPSTRGPHPVVIVIHGGCWLSAYDIAYMGKFEQALADSGYAVWSIEYRRVGDDGGGWPNSFTDVAHGADKLRDVAKQYDLDLTRVIASGHSAGGGFALWLAARRKIAPSSELYTKDPLPIRAVFGLAPAPDLEMVQAAGTCGGVIGKLMGGSPAEQEARYAAASLTRLVPVGVPQTLVFGLLDRQWTPVGRSYLARAQAAGDSTIRVVELPESGHFEMVNPASSSWPAVIAALKGAVAALPRR